MRLHKIGVAALLLCTPRLGAQRAEPSAAEVSLLARLLAMTDTRTLDVPLVDSALIDKWQPLRAAAALAVGQVGAEPGGAGAQRLRGLLRDPNRIVAANAAYALGLLRDTASLSVLASALSENHEIAREAAWALGEIGAVARPSLSSALKVPHAPDVSIQLLLAASKLRPTPITDIQGFLRNPNPSVVWAAAYSIARARAPAGVRALIDLESSTAVHAASRSAERTQVSPGPYVDIGTGYARTRAEIARGLAKSAAGDSLGPRAQTVLARLVADADPHVRINALRSIATYGSASRNLLLKATHDPDPNVRIAAAQSVGTVLDRRSGDFNALWDADTSLVYRASVLASAARAGLRPAQLGSWATSRDWRFRAAVANAAGDSIDRPFALSRATPLTRDPDPRVREAAFGALMPPAGWLLEDTVHSLLIAGLRDPDFYVRATVIGALGERPSAVDLPAVLASYNLAAHDSANDARLAALQYVVSAWKKDSTGFDASRLAAVENIQAPADPLERAAGKGIPAWSRWSTVVATPRPASWYEQVIREMVLPAYRGKTVTATIQTVRGPIHLELFSAEAPITAWNFLSLARSGYYRNTRFHRVVPNFVAQDGDPRDDGNGGPGYAIRDEMNRHRYERGAVGMALSGPDTGGSQYFITHSPQPHLDGHYTVFGRVVRGYDVLDKIVQGDLITSVDPK